MIPRGNYHTDSWLAKHHQALVANLAHILRIDAGLKEATLAGSHETLTEELAHTLDIAAGLRAVLPLIVNDGGTQDHDVTSRATTEDQQITKESDSLTRFTEQLIRLDPTTRIMIRTTREGTDLAFDLRRITHLLDRLDDHYRCAARAHDHSEVASVDALAQALITDRGEARALAASVGERATADPTRNNHTDTQRSITSPTILSGAAHISVMACDLDLAVTRIITTCIDLALTRLRSFASDLDRPLTNTSLRDLARDVGLVHARADDLNSALQFARNLADASATTGNLTGALDRARACAVDLASALALARARADDLACARDVTNALGLGPDLPRDLARDLACALVLNRTRALAATLDFERAHDLDRARRLANHLADELANNIANTNASARTRGLASQLTTLFGPPSLDWPDTPRAEVPTDTSSSQVLESAALMRAESLILALTADLDNALSTLRGAGGLRTALPLLKAAARNSQALREISAALNDFHGADLRDADLTQVVSLDGIRWTCSTLWPQEWRAKIQQGSVDLYDGVFEIREGVGVSTP